MFLDTPYMLTAEVLYAHGILTVQTFYFNSAVSKRLEIAVFYLLFKCVQSFPFICIACYAYTPARNTKNYNIKDILLNGEAINMYYITE